MISSGKGNPLLIREFEFLRDFRQIRWGDTIGFNFLRTFGDGSDVIVIGGVLGIIEGNIPTFLV